MERLRVVPDKFRVCTVATITMGNLAEEKGINLPTKHDVRKEEISSREKECVEDVRPDALRETFPIMFKTQRWEFKSNSNGKEKLEGKRVRGIWSSRSDDKPWDVLSLGLLCDSVRCHLSPFSTNFASSALGVTGEDTKDLQFAPAASVYIPDAIAKKLRLSFPTLSMSLEIKRDPKGCKYIFLKLVTYEIRNGRFDTDVFAYDEKGGLVALARHVSLFLEPIGKSEELGKILKL